MRFSEGDRVRNTRVDMGVGTIVRNSESERSVRWHTDGQWNWRVSWPDYRNPNWMPGIVGTEGWYRDDALEATEGSTT